MMKRMKGFSSNWKIKSKKNKPGDKTVNKQTILSTLRVLAQILKIEHTQPIISMI